MFGSITEYFYKYLAGIQSPMEDNTAVGYSHIHLQPFIPDSLKAAKATLETMAGTVVSDWKKEKDVFLYQVAVPANTTATVVFTLSGENNQVLYEGKREVWENGTFKEGVPGVNSAEEQSGRLRVHIGSGKYAFRLSHF
jgi:alpha-L-rhamnosidase